LYGSDEMTAEQHLRLLKDPIRHPCPREWNQLDEPIVECQDCELAVGDWTTDNQEGKRL
jgi:hypothetical protein